MRVISAQGNSVRNALAAARRVAGLEFEPTTREVRRSGGEDGLYRIELANGDVVEVTVIQHGFAIAQVLEQ